MATLAFATGLMPGSVVKIKSDPQQPIDGVHRLFETQNMWNFLLLDTQYGRVWQVQYASKDYESALIPINTEALVADLTNVPRIGRFTLYPTQNMWNFILLDQDTGNVWQCQYGVGTVQRFLFHIR